MAHIAIITTTINVPTVISRYVNEARAAGVWLGIYVAGDQKSPHDDIIKFLFGLYNHNRDCVATVEYVDPEWQERAWPELSGIVGWNTIQRRNFAILAAMGDVSKYGYEGILTIDDDNAPTAGFFTDLLQPAGGSMLVRGDWYNPGSQMFASHYARGFPYGRRHGIAGPFVATSVRSTPVIHQCMILGDPDINATERMERAPVVSVAKYPDVHTRPAQTFAPINTQATYYDIRYAGLMGLPPGLGRYDDIWQGYVAQRVLADTDALIRFGKPFVHQDRNEHNLFRDLRDELMGMEHTDQFCETLRAIPPLRGHAPVDGYAGYWLEAVNRLWHEPWMLEKGVVAEHPAYSRSRMICEFIPLWQKAVKEALI